MTKQLTWWQLARQPRWIGALLLLGAGAFVGFDAWRTADIVTSLSCPLGFIAVAIGRP